MSSVGEKIKNLRINEGWTQATLAEKLNVSESTVQKWEKGKNNTQIPDLQKICDMFNVSLDRMVDEKAYIPIIPDEGEWVPTTTQEYDSDGEHLLCTLTLKREGKLHRFINAGGVEYSAIYYKGREMFSCERSHERDMILAWNATVDNW